MLSQKLTYRFVILMLLFSLMPLATSLQASPISLKDFIRPTAMHNVKISPNGEYLAMLVAHEKENVLIVLNKKTKKREGLFRVKGKLRSIDSFSWVNDERLIYTISSSKGYDNQQFGTGELIGVNFNGKRHLPIWGWKSAEKIKAFYQIIDPLVEDKKHILIAAYPFQLNGSYWEASPNVSPKIYKLNVYSGKVKTQMRLPAPLASAITDNLGEIRIAYVVNKQNNNEYFHRDLKTDEWSPLDLSMIPASDVFVRGFTNSDDTLYISGYPEKGTEALYTFNLKNQQVEKIVQDKAGDIYEYIREFSGRKIVGLSVALGKSEYFYLEPNNKKVKLHATLAKAFSDQNIFITSSTRDGDSVIAFVQADDNPGDYYLFNAKTNSAEHLGSRRQWFSRNGLASTESLTFKTRDDQTIYGYLTQSKTSNKSNMPLVVLPHGGPHGIRDFWGFDSEVQLLASHGYAVLQVNYRGSDGFGLAFEKAGYGQWGGLMQDDITDATRALIESGRVDKNRICIFGHSFGGYSAMMSAAREPDLYQCAIGSMGVYSLPLMFEEGDIPENIRGINFLKDVLGEDVAKQKANSPVFNADKIKAEVFLMHGSRDERAPIEHAEAMREAFEKVGKSYQWLELGKEGHGINGDESRIEAYGKILKFLERNIGAKATAETASK